MMRYLLPALLLLLSPVAAAAAETEPPVKSATQEMVDEYFKLGEYFNEQAADAREIAQRIVNEAYKAREKSINEIYEKEISEAENEQRDMRNQAIERFEAFLKKYPANPKYSPDAMFRLSELYYERAYDRYLVENDAYEEALTKGQEPPAPVKHYEDTIAMMQRIIAEYPDYRLLDGCYYLLAYCLSEQMEDDRAIVVYEELVELLPQSRFIPEVLTRIGEYYFETNDLDKALSAYSRVMDYPESAMYDKALYKLAWTHYRMADTEENAFHYDAAVDNFIKLVDFAESQKAKGESRGFELRPEAIQYVAISFAEEQWGSLDKLIKYFEEAGGRPYAREVFFALGDIYFDQTKYSEAIQVYDYIQATFPLQEDSPVVQDKIVKAYEKQREFEKATQAREILVRNFSRGSEWYEKFQHNESVIRKAEQLTSQSLLSAAQFHHNQAQTYKESGQNQLAVEEYAFAAQSYGEYLERFPSDRLLYELKFYYADCLYYSQKFHQAADLFSWVRDSDMDTKFQEPAAVSAVLAYENQIKLEEIEGTRQPLKVVTSAERMDNKVEPKELDAIYRKLVKSSDIYLQKVPNGDNAATTEYNAAQIYFAHDNFPEARKRFMEVIRKYPDNQVAEYASNLLIESYMIEEKWLLVEETVNQVLAMNLTAASAGYNDELKKFKVGAIFMRAQETDAAGNYDEAADLYLRLVGEMKGNEYEDRALNNAAIAYEKAKRFESATNMYERLYKEYPKSPLADNAVFRVALNAESFFDFEGSIEANMNLVNNYPKSPKRADALYNAAITMENTQQYERAIEHLEMYTRLFKDREDVAEAYYRIAELYEKLKNWHKVVDAYQAFIKKFSRDDEQGHQVVKAHLALAKTYKRLKQNDKYKKELQLVVSSFAKLEDKTKANGYAAEAAFLLVELDRPAYEKIRLVGTSKEHEKILKQKAQKRSELEKRYEAIYSYKYLEWTMAAMTTIGLLRSNMVEMLQNMECPTDFKRIAYQNGFDYEELCIEYIGNMQEAMLAAGTEVAITSFINVQDTGREFKVANKWTKLAKQKLYELGPDEYPLEKEPKSIANFEALMIDTGMMMANGETVQLGRLLQNGRDAAAAKAQAEEEAQAAAQAAAEEAAAKAAAEAAAAEAARELEREKRAAAQREREEQERLEQERQERELEEQRLRNQVQFAPPPTVEVTPAGEEPATESPAAASPAPATPRVVPPPPVPEDNQEYQEPNYLDGLVY